ncbi:MAG: hypothetical protein HND47_09525 [Chloroflexi bacterium]|nr:hypothetical protein [Chloroflexota bacterium]
MNAKLNSLAAKIPKRPKRLAVIALVVLITLLTATVVLADIHTRIGVRGTVPNPGTQQQELANITFPAPYNVFGFIVTCAACHGGQVDQQVAHFGNWSGTAMASAARDPVFRANQIIVNSQIRNADRTGRRRQHVLPLSQPERMVFRALRPDPERGGGRKFDAALDPALHRR